MQTAEKSKPAIVLNQKMMSSLEVALDRDYEVYRIAGTG